MAARCPGPRLQPAHDRLVRAQDGLVCSAQRRQNPSRADRLRVQALSRRAAGARPFRLQRSRPLPGLEGVRQLGLPRGLSGRAGDAQGPGAQGGAERDGELRAKADRDRPQRGGGRLAANRSRDLARDWNAGWGALRPFSTLLPFWSFSRSSKSTRFSMACTSA